MDTRNMNTCPIPNGTLLVIGGHENKGEAAEKKVQESDDFHPLEILRTFVKLTGKKEPVIEVVTTASAEGAEPLQDYVKAFKELGLSSIGHIHHDKRADALTGDALERISKADTIFLSGGDQLKLTSVYGVLLFSLRLSSDTFLMGWSSGVPVLVPWPCLRR